ncbi:hypothetical protein VNO78_08621 [Psophocarpus tetragonolobus]|uniref:Uncharacterized protein n=1 Tax=Psophocarpus tetragonolobus TaxID=3891 RepID=A0AAN9T5J1_PSOTE
MFLLQHKFNYLNACGIYAYVCHMIRSKENNIMHSNRHKKRSKIATGHFDAECSELLVAQRESKGFLSKVSFAPSKKLRQAREHGMYSNVTQRHSLPIEQCKVWKLSFEVVTKIVVQRASPLDHEFKHAC